MFAYSVNTACDDGNFILEFAVKAGNVHDSSFFYEVYNNVLKKFKDDMKIVAVDAGYITPHICKTILDDNLLPSMPYKRPMTKKGFMRKHQYVYDEHYDCYICEKNELLMYSTTNRDGYREYKSDPEKCKNCSLLNQCTIKGAYKRRKETIERVFADGKEKHGLRYTQLPGITNVITEITLKYAAMNLKKLGKMKWMRA